MTSGPRRCGVLGDPIDHSLSPTIHTAAYRALGLEGWEYDAVLGAETATFPDSTSASTSR